MTHGRTWNNMLRISSWHYVPCVQSGAGLLPESPQGKLNHVESFVQGAMSPNFCFFLKFVDCELYTWRSTYRGWDDQPRVLRIQDQGTKSGFNCMPWSGRLGHWCGIRALGDAGNRHARSFLSFQLHWCPVSQTVFSFVGFQWISDLLNLPIMFLKKIPTIPW